MCLDQRLPLLCHVQLNIITIRLCAIGGASCPSRGVEDEETTIVSTVKGTLSRYLRIPRINFVFVAESGTAQGTARDISSQSELSASHGGSSQQSIFSATALTQGVHEQLLQARAILESGLDYVSMARTVVALTDGKSIADVVWHKVQRGLVLCVYGMTITNYNAGFQR